MLLVEQEVGGKFQAPIAWILTFAVELEDLAGVVEVQGVNPTTNHRSRLPSRMKMKMEVQKSSTAGLVRRLGCLAQQHPARLDRALRQLRSSLPFASPAAYLSIADTAQAVLVGSRKQSMC